MSVGQTIFHVNFLKHTKESDCILLCLETEIEAKYVYNFMQRFYYNNAPQIRVCDENLKVVYSYDSVREKYMERQRQFIEYQNEQFRQAMDKFDKFSNDADKLIEIKKLDIRKNI